MNVLIRAVIVGMTLFSMPASILLADDAAIKVQGRGSRREALDEMCYKPFDASLLSKLGPWANGAAITEADIKGKPVLLVSWANWYKTSLGGLTLAQQLADQNKDLIVIGIHQQRGWEQAADALKANKIAFVAAHDSKGEVFKTLRLDGSGPNFYIVDRAGNMRFADVERGSVEAAVKIVSDESQADAAAAKPPTRGGSKAGDGKTAADAYKNAKWPKFNTNADLRSAKDSQGKPLPVALGKETWITPKVDLEGKVVVLDFWATWCGPCRKASPIFDELQEKYKNQAVIIGVSGQKQPNFPEDVNAVKKYLAKNPSGYSHINDTKQNVYKPLEIQGIPHVVIISTDGVIRWQGNPHDKEFRAALEAVVAADPGLKAGKPATKGSGEPPKP